MFDDDRSDFGFLLQPSAEEDTTGPATDSNDAAAASIVVPPGTVIESTGSTVLTRVGANYFLHPVGDSNGVQLSAFGAAVTAGSSGGWNPVAVEAVSDGYEVMWQYGSDQYTLWRGIDGTGNFTGSGISAGLGSYALAAAESTFGQDFNRDGQVGPRQVTVEGTGTARLVQLADTYFLADGSGVVGPSLKYKGTAVTAGSSGGWNPVAVEAVSDGYEVMWQYGSDQYTLWRGVDGTGNFTGSGISAGLGSYALAAAESTFGRDFDHDNAIGFIAIEAAGSTSLAMFGGHYYLLQADSQPGPQLTYGGAAVRVGMFGALAPIGAEQTASGYQVVWKADGADQYSIWNTDSGGNYLSTLGGGITGSNVLLLTLESAFGQDLNGSGAIAAPVAVEAAGATDLVKFDGTYFLRPEGGSLGPQLKYNGVAVTDGSGWSVIGAEANGSGSFLVAWKNTSTNEFKIWNVDGNGNYLSGDSVLSGATTAFQSRETTFQQDLNGDETVGIKTTVIESVGATALQQTADGYFLGASGPLLKYLGSAVTESQFAGWTPIGVEAVVGGYRVAWKDVGSEEYKIWSVDSGGNYASGHGTVLSGATLAFQALEPTLQQDLNLDGTIGIRTTVIENVGSSVLAKRANTYQIDGFDVTYQGPAVVEGQFPGWSPIGAERSLHTLVWKLAGADQYQIWNIGLSGNYLSSVTVSGGSLALQSAETALGQDLNGDGTIGPVTTVLETDGSIALTQVADTYELRNGASGPQLKYAAAAVTVGQFSGWTPIAAEQVRDGYQVVWKSAGNQFKVWNVDSAGNYLSGDVALSGISMALETAETTFGKDFNGDGTIGVVATVLETAGSIDLTQVADTYELRNGASGPVLKYAGAAVTAGQFSGWTPIGAEQVGDGYQVAWKSTGNQFKVWTVDSAGNYVSGDVARSGFAVGANEATFAQDLNGDGTVGVVPGVIEANGLLTLKQIGDTYQLVGGTANLLKYAGAVVTEGQFGGWVPIAADWSPGGGYKVVWKSLDNDQYKVWDIDSNANYISGNDVILSGNSLILQLLEPQLGNQDFNGDGSIGPIDTGIESQGNASLVSSGDGYRILQSFRGPTVLQMNGQPVVAGQNGGWTPISAESTGSGYQVVWKNAAGDQYKFWTTNFSGNYQSGDSTVMSAGSAVLQLTELGFAQDLNSDGRIGPAIPPIETAGSIDLAQVDNTYYLWNGLSGPQLKYNGTPVTDGQFAGWKPVGAEQVSGGYKVAWKLTGADQFKIWTTDSSGNYVSGDVAVLGSTYALQTAESTLQQDLNGDGTTGPVTIQIENLGGVSLSKSADTYVMGSTPLSYNNVLVTDATFPGWAPIGAQGSDGGIIWKLMGADQYRIFSVSFSIDGASYSLHSPVTVTGDAFALQNREYKFAQDLNSDQRIGLAPTVIEASGDTTLSRAADAYVIGTIGSSGATAFLQKDGQQVVVGQTGGWTPFAVDKVDGLSGYQVVWELAGADQYKIWAVGSDGAYQGGDDVILTPGSWALQSIEAAMGQELNGDDRLGPLETVIEQQGDTSVSTAADAYLLRAPGETSPDVLRMNGAQVVVGQTGGWTLIGAESTAYGMYKVVWKLVGAEQYKVWEVDTVGGYFSGDSTIMSGSAAGLRALEYLFEQDLNSDGQLLLTPTVVEAAGATTVTTVGGNYYLTRTAGGTGIDPVLSYNGSPASDSAGWTVIGAEHVDQAGVNSSYYVVWKNVDTAQYRVWYTDRAGNYVDDYGVMSGSDWIIRYLEGVMGQDLNADGATALPNSPFDITLTLTANSVYNLYFQAAAARWEQVITADIPDVTLTSPTRQIDDLKIATSVVSVDGVGGALAGAGVDRYRSSSAGGLPSESHVNVDSADAAVMKADGRLFTAIVHEMSHALGLGSGWAHYGLANSTQYFGQYALAAYRELSGDASATYVPLETAGGSGTAGKHWSEAIFGNELLTGYAEAAGVAMPLSILTIASLRDIGYSVDYAQAEAYNLA